MLPFRSYHIFSCSSDDDELLTPDDELVCINSLEFNQFCETPEEVFVSEAELPDNLLENVSLFFDDLSDIVGFKSQLCDRPDSLIFIFESIPNVTVDTFQILDSCFDHYAEITRSDSDFEFREPIETLSGVEIDGFIDFILEINIVDGETLHIGGIVDDSEVLCGSGFCTLLFNFDENSMCNLCLN